VTTAPAEAKPAAPAEAKPAADAVRAVSVDVLRGLTIGLMVLVNDASSAPLAPWWLKHMPAGVNGMTPADVVVPAFLFVVGMAVPLALRAAERRGERPLTTIRHALWRTFGLLVMGVFMANRHDNTGAHSELWIGLMYVGFIATWSEIPKQRGALRSILVIGRVLGIACLSLLALVFRGPAGERLVGGPLFDPSSEVWLRHATWDVLGQIGWAYLATVLVYLAVGPRRHVLVAWASVLLLLTPLTTAPVLPWLHAHGVLEGARSLLGPIYAALAWAHSHVHFGRIGLSAAMALWGCALGTLLLAPRPARDRIRVAATWSVAWVLAALVFYPFYGVSKVAATPSWALASIAITASVWALIVWVVDVRGATRWTRWLRPAAENPLLAYFLHPLVKAALELTPGVARVREWTTSGSHPAIAVLGAVAVTAVVVWLTGVAGRRGLRVKV
jgi:heparan-alpha-glucosaminide N-acetyltransferase